MLITLACLSLASAALIAAAAQADQPYLSPLAVALDKQTLTIYIAQSTAKQVAVFGAGSEKVTGVINLKEQPSGLALSPDGSRLYVTAASAAGKVYIVDTYKQKVIGKISVGHSPIAPVVSANGKTLYVCNQFDNNVSVVNLASKKQVSTIPVSREPFVAAITPDGETLYVANLLPKGSADKDYAAAQVSVIDTAKNNVTYSIALPNGSTALHGICVSPDGRFVYLTHILARYQLPTTQLERGWMNTNALSVINARTAKLVNTVLLDDVDLGAANPWAVECTDDGKYICVTHAGTHELSVIDRAALHEKLDKVAAGEKVSEVSLTAEDVPNDLSFLVGIRRRIKLTGNSPRGLAMVESNAYIAEYFTDTLGIVDINPDLRPEPKSVPLGPKLPLTVARKGEMLFHDAIMCFQHWQSCSSCHPGVRTDGLNWDLLNDGMGNPKNTKSLLLSHKTPPSMASGIRGTAEKAVRAGIRHIQFAVRPEEDAVSIDEFLKSLEPIHSPYLKTDWLGKKPKLSKAAKRGKMIFQSADCATCHTGPLLTDLQQYQVDAGRDREKNNAFDTPTLVEVWRTAPYLHDGSAATIEEVLTTYNTADKHGVTSNLTKKQIDDLAEFVLSQ